MEDESIQRISVKKRLKLIQMQREYQNWLGHPQRLDRVEIELLEKATELLERAAEEIESVYGGETELTEEIKEFVGK